MTLLSRMLHRLPAVQRLEKACDRLRAEQNSALLKARAISAKMGVLDAQVRTLRGERDNEAEKARNLTADCQSTVTEFQLASEACDALTKERDALAADRGALTAQRDQAIHQRDQLARELDRYRQHAVSGLDQQARIHCDRNRP